MRSKIAAMFVALSGKRIFSLFIVTLCVAMVAASSGAVPLR
jgi:hypothetical protein